MHAYASFTLEDLTHQELQRCNFFFLFNLHYRIVSQTADVYADSYFSRQNEKNDGIGGELFYFLNIPTSTISWMFYMLLFIVWILRIFASFTLEAIASEIFF